MTESTTNCGDIDELLPDYLEETLDETTRKRVRLHVSSCARCTSLIAELEGITAGAARLAELRPSHDLWEGIAARIETPVIALGADDVIFSRRRPAWLLGVIAAGLVLATAGITNVLTRRSFEAEQLAALDQREGRGTLVPSPVESTSVMPTESKAPTTPTVTPPAPAATSAGTPRPRAVSVQLVARSAADREYDREISRLRAVLKVRRAQLDPETVKVIETSLRVIDEAINQSRAALAKDPASAFLRDRLDNSLEKKVDLLRTAAMLPART
jgi:hypothetical protein